MPKLDLSILKKLAPGKPVTPPTQAQAAPPPTPLEIKELREKSEIQKLQIELLNLIIERYKKFIEDGETKSMSELQVLVKPLDATVTEIRIQIEDQFHPYSYDSNFLLATQKAMDIIFSWKKIKMPLSFWMSFEDMAKLKAADDLDRAIILCSVFRALGSDSAKVLIGKDKSAWTTFVFGEKIYVANIGDRTMSAYPDKSEGFAQFMYNMSYSFNDREHEELNVGTESENEGGPSADEPTL